MRWELSEEQRLLQDSLQAWLAKQCSPSAVRGWQDNEDPRQFEQSLVAEAWLGVGTAEDLGGEGGGLIELSLAAEAFGQVAAPSSAWLATVLAIPAFAGNPDLGVAAVVKGEFAALAVPAGDPPGGAATATFDGERLHGRVDNVLGADRVRHLVVPVRAAGVLRLMRVDAGAEGVDITPRRLLDRSRTVADVVFDGAPAAALDVDADAVLTAAALRAAVLVAADSLGAMDRMLSMSVEYSKQRHQFGTPIGAFQAVKHAAATMLVGVEAARSITYFAAASVDQHHPESTLHAAVAKAQVTAEATRAADSALTLHGAIGYTWEYDLQLLYKRAMLNAPMFGSPEIWNERLARALPLGPVE
ncbi:MAG: acyl-CoA dehydrogenase protein [Pseudonocardiales bacterium]|jgi:alkylation response protein AidB-like acyl-CoA dehydrogenase|nr:acyl-CoA dehydrogenase protein [Pseudonocardiales bacterium]